MNSWRVYIQASGDDGPRVSRFALGVLVGILATHGGTVTGRSGRRSWGATLSVEAVDAGEALLIAAAVVASASAEAGLSGWPVVRAEVVREDLLHD